MRERWNQRYRDGAGLAEPSAFLEDAAAHLPLTGRALDLAGGAGRHALWLARRAAREVPAGVEAARAVPVVEALAKRFDVPVSIDTRKAEVAEAALDAGARLVNDVSGLRHDPQLAEVAARHAAQLVLGHLRPAGGRVHRSAAARAP